MFSFCNGLTSRHDVAQKGYKVDLDVKKGRVAGDDDLSSYSYSSIHKKNQAAALLFVSFFFFVNLALENHIFV